LFHAAVGGETEQAPPDRDAHAAAEQFDVTQSVRDAADEPPTARVEVEGVVDPTRPETVSTVPVSIIPAGVKR
jgi:hypothetical protein